jgi:hypothetical protein
MQEMGSIEDFEQLFAPVSRPRAPRAPAGAHQAFSDRIGLGTRRVHKQIRSASAIVAPSGYQDEHHREHQREHSGRDH